MYEQTLAYFTSGFFPLISFFYFFKAILQFFWCEWSLTDAVAPLLVSIIVWSHGAPWSTVTSPGTPVVTTASIDEREHAAMAICRSLSAISCLNTSRHTISPSVLSIFGWDASRFWLKKFKSFLFSCLITSYKPRVRSLRRTESQKQDLTVFT